MSAAYRAAPKEVRCTSSRCRSLLPCCSPPWRQGRGRAIQLWLRRSTEREQRSPIPPGDRRARSTCGWPPRTTPTASRRWSPARAAYVSNRIFNDVGQNLFSENDISQWGWAWGQFIDHDIGLRDETPAEPAPIAFDADRPARGVPQRLRRDRLLPHAGRAGHRRHARRGSRSTRSRSYIDASGVYGGTTRGSTGCARARSTATRRTTGATLLLPRAATSRAPTPAATRAAAPAMDLMGALRARRPSRAVVAGDVRANENIALTAIHTLFAREHNRIVAALPPALAASRSSRSPAASSARRSQYITYNEFLPALGVELDAVPRLRPDRQPGARERVRRRRLPGAQHDPRRVRADRSRRARTPPRSSTRSGSRASTVERQRRRHGHARDPARRRVRQPGPARAGRRRPGAASLGGSPVQERRADRQLAAQRAVPGAEAGRPGPDRVRVAGDQPGLLHGRRPTSARSTSSAAATTGCRPTTTSGGPTGSRRARRSRRSPASRPSGSRPIR